MKKLLLFLVILSSFCQINAFGPKKFIKSNDGNFWCRDRVNHPGRQCCESVRQETLTSRKIFAKNSKINVIDRGYGYNCDLNCVCKVTEKKCKKKEDCTNEGTGFACNQGKCQLPCVKDLECVKKFGNEFGCQKKFCSKLKIVNK